MSHEDELIHFLNGFNKFSKNEVFLDENGLPTDHFLEALKTDTNIAPLTAHRSHFVPKDEDLDILYQEYESMDDNHAGIQLENPRNTANFRKFSQSLNSDRKGLVYRRHDSEEEASNEKKKPKPKKKATRPSNTVPLHAPKSPAVVEEVHFPKEAFDATEIEVEAQSKIKALNLRLSGQRNTIRSLEQQLAETTEVLTARNKQLAVAHARLKALDSKFNTKQATAGDDVRLKAAEEAVEKYKKQADLMQAKFLEEQVKRQRAEEKARVLKEYAEKSKNRCQSLEVQNAELNGLNVELNAKMEKYRKGYKEQAADVSAHRAAINERDCEVLSYKQKLEKAESALRNIQMELEHCREQLRVERAQHKVTQSKVKQLDIQMEILHEKEATKRAEQRLHDLEGVTQRHRTIASLQQQQQQQHQRQFEQNQYDRTESFKDYYSDSDSQANHRHFDSAPGSHHSSRQQRSVGRTAGSGGDGKSRVRSLSPTRHNSSSGGLSHSREESPAPMQWVKYHTDASDEALDRDVLRMSAEYRGAGGIATAGIAAYDHSDRHEKKAAVEAAMRSPSEDSSHRKKPLPRYVLSSSNHSVGSARSEASGRAALVPSGFPAAVGSSGAMSTANFIKNKVANSSAELERSFESAATHDSVKRSDDKIVPPVETSASQVSQSDSMDDMSSVSSNNRSAPGVMVEIQNHPVRVTLQPSPSRNSESSRLQKLYNRVTAINNSSMTSN